MLDSIFEALGTIVEGFLTVLSSLFSNVVDIFWIAPQADVAGGFTFLGYILLIGVGSPLVFWGINWVIGLFRRIVKR